MRKLFLEAEEQLSGKEPSSMCKTLGSVLSAEKKENEVTPSVFCAKPWRMTFIFIDSMSYVLTSQ